MGGFVISRAFQICSQSDERFSHLIGAAHLATAGVADGKMVADGKQFRRRQLAPMVTFDSVCGEVS